MRCKIVSGNSRETEHARDTVIASRPENVVHTSIFTHNISTNHLHKDYNPAIRAKLGKPKQFNLLNPETSIRGNNVCQWDCVVIVRLFNSPVCVLLDNQLTSSTFS